MARRLKPMFALLLVFVVGFGVGSSLDFFSGKGSLTEKPSFFEQAMGMVTGIAPELASPGSRISQDQVLVLDNGVTISLKNPEWATFTNTNSMDPVLDENTLAIEVVPSSPDDLTIGDIASYDSGHGIIIHRIIEKGTDENGVYFIFKGDNAPIPDPSKVRFSQIQRVVVALLY